AKTSSDKTTDNETDDNEGRQRRTTTKDGNGNKEKTLIRQSVGDDKSNYKTINLILLNFITTANLDCAIT
ncbi:5067_t:CDS:1, partial [Cetraspora pellucida]